MVSSAKEQVVAVVPALQPVISWGEKTTVVAPVPGVPVSTTEESRGKGAEQVPGHVIPAGELVTVPVPATTTVSDAWVQALVPTPAADTNADPDMMPLPTLTVAVTLPVPQSLMSVARPFASMLSRP